MGVDRGSPRMKEVPFGSWASSPASPECLAARCQLGDFPVSFPSGLRAATVRAVLDPGTARRQARPQGRGRASARPRGLPAASSRGRMASDKKPLTTRAGLFLRAPRAAIQEVEGSGPALPHWARGWRRRPARPSARDSASATRRSPRPQSPAPRCDALRRPRAPTLPGKWQAAPAAPQVARVLSLLLNLVSESPGVLRIGLWVTRHCGCHAEMDPPSPRACAIPQQGPRVPRKGGGLGDCRTWLNFSNPDFVNWKNSAHCGAGRIW